MPPPAWSEVPVGSAWSPIFLRVLQVCVFLELPRGGKKHQLVFYIFGLSSHLGDTTGRFAGNVSEGRKVSRCGRSAGSRRREAERNSQFMLLG